MSGIPLSENTLLLSGASTILGDTHHPQGSDCEGYNEPRTLSYRADNNLLSDALFSEPNSAEARERAPTVADGERCNVNLSDFHGINGSPKIGMV